jgi:hypothetical protein
MTIETTCTYLGDAMKPCGCRAVEGKSYCAEHVFVVYQKGSANRKRHKDTRRANAIRDLISDFNAAVEELESEGFDVHGDSELKPVELDDDLVL